MENLPLSVQKKKLRVALFVLAIGGVTVTTTAWIVRNHNHYHRNHYHHQQHRPNRPVIAQRAASVDPHQQDEHRHRYQHRYPKPSPRFTDHDTHQEESSVPTRKSEGNGKNLRSTAAATAIPFFLTPTPDADLEETLLSDHAMLESFLAETTAETDAPVPKVSTAKDPDIIIDNNNNNKPLPFFLGTQTTTTTSDGKDRVAPFFLRESTPQPKPEPKQPASSSAATSSAFLPMPPPMPPPVSALVDPEVDDDGNFDVTAMSADGDVGVDANFDDVSSVDADFDVDTLAQPSSRRRVDEYVVGVHDEQDAIPIPIPKRLTNERTTKPQQQQQQQHQQQQKKEPSPIEESVYNFNRAWIDALYTTMEILYPTSTTTTTTASWQKPALWFGSQMQMQSMQHLPWIAHQQQKDKLKHKLHEAAASTAGIPSRGFAKFYVLETIARTPFFAYLSVMHLKETLGDRGRLHRASNESQNQNENQDQDQNNDVSYRANLERTDTMRMHYARADNEFHHLLVVEELMRGGGSGTNDDVHIDDEGGIVPTAEAEGATTTGPGVLDRWLARSLSVVQYWLVVAAFLWNESAAYHLGELLQDRKIRAYDEFLDVHESELRTRPVPESAKHYYETEYETDPFLFHTVCALDGETSPDRGVDGISNRDSSSDTSRNHGRRRRRRRPHSLSSLYDVIRNLRDDDLEHWMALCNLVQYGAVTAVDSATVRSTIPAVSDTNADSITE